MRIKHRYVFNNDGRTEIIDYCEKNRIKYEISYCLVTLEIFEDNYYWNAINDLMVTYRILDRSEIVYSKNELETARWLRVRSKWRSEYPQPEDDFEYKKITYDSKNYCSECGRGLVQHSNFLLKKTPAWGKRNFLMINWVHDEFFVTETVARKLLSSDLEGFSIIPVNHFETGKPLNNTFQIQIVSYLQAGFVFGEGDVREEITCAKCGTLKKVLSGTHLLRARSEDFHSLKTDILKMPDLFGDGHSCIRAILISNAFYRFLLDNRWDRELFFEPVFLLDE